MGLHRRGALAGGSAAVVVVACWLALQGLGGRQQKPTRIGDADLPPVTLSSTIVEQYNKTGYAVIRGALPAWVVKELYAVARRSYPIFRPDVTFKDTGGASWWFVAHQPWMVLDELADLLMHRDAPLGALASQLMGAEEVRVGQEALRGASAAAPGRGFHLDHKGMIGLFSFPPREEPITNMFLVLAEQEFNTSGTGGSLTVVPSSRFLEYGDSPCSTVVASSPEALGGSPECVAWLEARAVTLDIALGDVVFYSSSIPHKSQLMRHGDRISYVARFINMDGLNEKLSGLPICSWPPHACDGSQWMEFDRLGVHSCCSDWSQGVHEYDHVLPSVYTSGVSRSTSACKPQVFPRPIEREVAARRAGHVQNHLTTGWRYSVKSYPVLVDLYNKMMMSWLR